LENVTQSLLEEEKNLFTIEEFDDSQFEQMRTEKLIKDGQIKEIEDQIHNLELKLGETNEYESRSDLLSIIDLEINDIRKESRLLNHKFTKVKEYREGLKNILTNVRSEMVQVINPIVQRWIQTFIQSESEIPYLSYELNVLEKTTEKTHSVKYEDNAKRYGVPMSFNNLSTGQRAICSLALIFAIEEVSLHKIDLMIFDEIHTSGIDDHGLAEILEILVNLTSQTRIMFIERREDVINYLKDDANEKNVPYAMYNIKSIDGISHATKEI
jgi:chromosome segregation ATPase